MANMECTTCLTQWDSADTHASYYFASSGGTYKRGDYASPALIAAAVEDISYCPSCQTFGPLKRVTELMGGHETQQIERGKNERETASKGRADVVHPPEE